MWLTFYVHEYYTENTHKTEKCKPVQWLTNKIYNFLLKSMTIWLFGKVQCMKLKTKIGPNNTMTYFSDYPKIFMNIISQIHD